MRLGTTDSTEESVEESDANKMQLETQHAVEESYRGSTWEASQIVGQRWHEGKSLVAVEHPG